MCLRLFEANFPRVTTNQKHSPDLGIDTSSVWNFCARPSAVISRARPVVMSQNVGCFLRLKIRYIQPEVIKSFRRMDLLDRNEITTSGSVRPVSFDGFTLNLFFFHFVIYTCRKKSFERSLNSYRLPI